MRVSVVIPIYNVEKYIERCARSLFEQTLWDMEFIFVDDASTDNSMTILKSLLLEYPHRQSQTKILTHTFNQGLASARQDGFDYAEGEYVICCDSDDWTEKNMYELMYQYAISYNADIVCCNYYAEYSNRSIECKYSYVEETKNIIKKSFPETLNSAVWNKLVKRDLYHNNSIRWFKDVNMYEDLGVTMRLRILSRKTIIIPISLYHYNKQNANSMATSPSIQHVNQQIKCASLLANWIESNADDSYIQLVRTIKFWAKAALIVHPSIQDFDRWISTFPETNSRIMLYKGMPLYNRISMWLLQHGFRNLAKILIYLKSYLAAYKLP